jgi:hypothetical protein
VRAQPGDGHVLLLAVRNNALVEVDRRRQSEKRTFPRPVHQKRHCLRLGARKLLRPTRCNKGRDAKSPCCRMSSPDLLLGCSPARLRWPQSRWRRRCVEALETKVDDLAIAVRPHPGLRVGASTAPATHAAGQRCCHLPANSLRWIGRSSLSRPPSAITCASPKGNSKARLLQTEAASAPARDGLALASPPVLRNKDGSGP